MPVEPTPATRPSLRLRADVPEPETDLALDGWPGRRSWSLAALFVADRRGEPGAGAGRRRGSAWPRASRSGRSAGSSATGTPRLWPASVALGRVWAFFEEVGPTQGAVRWPSAIAGGPDRHRARPAGPADDRAEGRAAGRARLVRLGGGDRPIGGLGPRPDRRAWARSRRSTGSWRGGRAGRSGLWASLAFLAGGLAAAGGPGAGDGGPRAGRGRPGRGR